MTVISSIPLKEIVGAPTLTEIETSEAIISVARDVGVYDIEEYDKAETMGFIDEGFEFFRGAGTGRNGEWICDVVSERAVVSVFLNSHELDGVVA